MRGSHIRRPGRTFAEVEIARGVSVQVESELVIIIGYHHVVVKILVEVSFTILVQIVQAIDLVATSDIDRIVDDLQPERLKHPGGKPLPRQLVELVVDAGNNPNVTVKSANRRAAIREEVEA